ncbi:MAG TPA: flippase activity-associated protein Agl23 [Verrucomicrobiae bacterium]|nr:flippase activity-associated protein Agl23 [Verrucomicrobiae bacterium]
MNRTFALGLLFALMMAAALRLPQLGARPMHNDEGVNAIKLRGLWGRGSYQYDPQEYHGPTLPYISWVWMKLTGPKNFTSFDEAQLRTITVLFGLGLIFLIPLIADGLGKRAAICAAVMTAISPAMVFYSRYYIHEMLLVFFTFLALAAGWRYFRSRKIGWAILTGAAVGLMQSTKETFLLAIAAMAVALIAEHLWSGVGRMENTERPFKWNFKHIAIALGVWVVVMMILFSSFFTNWSGPMDSVLTYFPWLHRAGGASPHIHPWNFYLERLAWFHVRKGPVWSEGLILFLALIGLVAAFIRKGITEGDRSFVRFVAFYTILLTVAYCAIGYKTPWCLLSFWQGMILLAGVGTVSLLHWLRKRPLQIVAGVLLLVGGGQLACQAWRANVEYAADPRNPYVYAQTSPDATNLVALVKALGDVSPQRQHMLIKVMAPENAYGPLPWYLRDFDQTGWWSELPPDPYAPVMIVSTKFNAALDEKKTHLMAGLFELRPSAWFEVYVETNLWHDYLETKGAKK